MIYQYAIHDDDWALLAFYMSCLSDEEKECNTVLLKSVVSHPLSFPTTTQELSAVEAAYPQLPE